MGALFLKQEKAAEMWAMMPQDRILFETDAPYRVDETKYNEAVQENLRRLVEIAGEEPEALEERLIKNAEDFCGQIICRQINSSQVNSRQVNSVTVRQCNDTGADAGIG